MIKIYTKSKSMYFQLKKKNFITRCLHISPVIGLTLNFFFSIRRSFFEIKRFFISGVFYFSNFFIFAICCKNFVPYDWDHGVPTPWEPEINAYFFDWFLRSRDVAIFLIFYYFYKIFIQNFGS